MKQAKFEEALNAITTAEESKQLTKDELIQLLYRKSTAYIELGRYKEGKIVTEQLLETSRELGSVLGEFDGVINTLWPLKELKRMKDGFEFVQRGEELLKELYTSQNFEMKKRKAEFLYFKAHLHLENNELDQAFRVFNACKTLSKETKSHIGLIESFLGLGHVYHLKNEFQQALKHYKKSLSISEELEYQQGIYGSLSFIGHSNLSRGELNQALECFQKSLTIIKKIGNRHKEGDILNSIGIIYTYKGDPTLALEYYQKSLAIWEEIEYLPRVGLLFNNIGQIFGDLGDFNTAADYFERALKISRRMGKWKLIVEVLYNSIKYSGQKHQKYRLARGFVLKSSDRLKDKTTAQTIFEKVAGEDIVWYELTIDAMLNLVETLIFELQITGSKAVLEKISMQIERLQSIAEKQHSFWLLTQIYWLQSKLALLEADLDRAQNLLIQAEQFAVEKGLGKIQLMIIREREFLVDQVSKWKDIIELKPSMNELIELTQLNTVLDQLIQRKVYYSDEEIIKYTEEAKQIIDSWVKT